MSVKFRLIAAVITALCMSMCMSLIMALVNVGIGKYLLFSWFRGWGIGFLVTFPLSYFLPPNIQRLLSKLGLK